MKYQKWNYFHKKFRDAPPTLLSMYMIYLLGIYHYILWTDESLGAENPLSGLNLAKDTITFQTIYDP